MVNANLVLRAVQTSLIIPSIALNGYTTHWYKAHTVTASAPSATVIPIAIGAVSLLALVYLFFNAPLQISQGHRTSNSRFFNKWAVLALDGCLAALWFVAGAQEAAFRTGLRLCFGELCKCMLAASVLGLVTGALFVATTILAAIHINRTRAGDAELPQARKAHEDWIGVVDGAKKETSA